MSKRLLYSSVEIVTRLLLYLAGIHVKLPAEASEFSLKNQSEFWASFNGLSCENDESLQSYTDVKIYGAKPPLYKH